MKTVPFILVLFLFFPAIGKSQPKAVTVPFILDHNRMLVEAEVQRPDGTWRKALLWVDTGNPAFLLSGELASELGITAPAAGQTTRPEAALKIRVGGMVLRCDTIEITVGTALSWLFRTMHNDGNIPSTLLRNYHVVFDYPARQITLAEPGTIKPRGKKSAAHVHPSTGIVQLDAVIGGESCSMALDNGASFSFLPDTMIQDLIRRHPSWPHITGAAGCANIWGTWPQEEHWPVVRIPEISFGSLTVRDAAIAGLPPFFRGGADLGTWYSRKTAQPVKGFLGPNFFGHCRVEIDYAGSAVYFDPREKPSPDDLCLVGITLAPGNDGRWTVAGVITKEGKPLVEGVHPGDILLRAGTTIATGATMGTVIDALHGKPGDLRTLTLERDGREFTVEAAVTRLL
jgi:hypothetical protein